MSLTTSLVRPVVVVKDAAAPQTFPLARPLAGFGFSISGGVPTDAIQVRNGEYLFDRAGDYISTRSQTAGGLSSLDLTTSLLLDFVAGNYRASGRSSSASALLTGSNPSLTYSAPSSSTMTDANGNIATVSAGTPRIGHHVWDGSAWVNEGLLLESEARTNLLLNSATLSTQSVTVSATAHTLSFTGTGTITLTGASTSGPLVGTGAGEQNRVSLTFTPTAGTLTLTVSGTVSNAQLEQGQTASSYIPTTGSTATRAAQSLTAPSSVTNWPTPQYIGSELVTNGTFDTDTGWTKGTGWTISGGTATHAGSGGTINQTISGLTVGAVYSYTATLDATGDTSLTNTSVQIRNSANTASIVQVLSSGLTANASNAVELVFVATETSHVVQSFSEDNVSFDNVSVREINPLAFSLHLAGRMTFADEDQSMQHVFWRWFKDNNNQIRVNYDTHSSYGTGRITFQQIDSNVYDLVNSAANIYPPGTLVPVNIASRHGTSFVNGAVDGTALTANTTPSALPDLSASNLQIAPDYMGTIKVIRQWAEDIGENGIESASQ
jgi:hypothetical protein